MGDYKTNKQEYLQRGGKITHVELNRKKTPLSEAGDRSPDLWTDKSVLIPLSHGAGPMEGEN